ncbi:MAG: nucleotidyltransferase [Planctomycetota bacterium]
MDSTLDILKRLNEYQVEFVIIGGMAGVAHGSSLVTEDLDVCVPLTRENRSRIMASLADLNPRWRMHPDRPPVPLHPAKLEGCKNIYILSDWGQVDFLSEVTGLGDFGLVSRRCVTMDIAGGACSVLSLDALIEAKRAMGRPKDIQAAMELEAIRERLM